MSNTFCATSTQMQCVEIVGMSNVGKSALLRLLAQPDVWVKELGEAAHDFLPIYVDCNRILDLTEQGFCELVLRCLRESSPALATLPELALAYETLVAPASDFQVPLSFSRGLTAVLADEGRKVVLLFDEFDDPYQQWTRASSSTCAASRIATARSLPSSRPPDAR
jgi:hypothetical protein